MTTGAGGTDDGGGVGHGRFEDTTVHGRADGAADGAPRRIVSLCPSLTELVFDLGAGDRLVGRTRFCVHPAGRVDAVEALGGTKDPDVARLVALAPELVLLNAEENRREDHAALEAAGVTCHVSLPRGVDDTAAMVRDIGSAIGRSAAAEAIAADIEARAARIRAAAEGAREVTFAALIWRTAASGGRATDAPSTWMAVSGDTFIHALLALAGGRNVFASAAERYPTVTAANLADAAPDVALLTSEPFPFADRHADELAAATGLPRHRFAFCDGELLSWHGSRTPRGLDHAEALIAAAR